MEEKIYISELAGHCNETTAWCILKEVSDALIHNGIRPIDPFCIEINDDGRFTLASEAGHAEHSSFDAPEHHEGQFTASEIAWSLGAVLFYVVMGGEVMNGKGSKGQRESSKLPYIRSEWPELSELVQQCLHYNPSKRPSLKEVFEKASQHYQHCTDDIRKGPKIKETLSDKPNDANFEENELAFWPELMKN